jgi:hypothetical protein
LSKTDLRRIHARCPRTAYQAADDKSLALDVVVDTSGDNIPGLVLAAIAGNDIDRGEIFAEIPREGVDRKALSV